MSRPKKDGFDYFPFDVNLDSKFQAIESLFGNDGYVWIVNFWREAYKNNQGIVNLNGILGVLKAKNCRITAEKQKEIISACIDLDMIYEKEPGIYTSHGIQKRILKITGEREYGRNYAKNELLDLKPPKKDLKSTQIELNRIESKENKYVPFSPAFRISFRLWKKIKEAGTNQKEPDLQKWASEVQKLHDTDKLLWDVIDQIMISAREDIFWIKNLRSTEALRKNILNGNFDKFRPKENLLTDKEYEEKVKISVEKENDNAL
jgi:hypothetical protein